MLEQTPREEDEVGFGRIVAFSDGVFAVAITLLVLTIEPPKLSGPLAMRQLEDRLTDLIPQIEAYFLAFAIVGRFWIDHHRFFNELRAFDVGLMALNLAYLSLIAFLPLPVAVFGDHAGVEAAVVFFAASMAAVGLVETLITYYAGRRGLLVGERASQLRRLVTVNLVAPTVFLLSIPVAFVSTGAVPWLWLAMIPLLARHGRRVRSREDARAGSQSPRST